MGIGDGKWELADSQKRLEKWGFAGIWANVPHEVIVPLVGGVPWCLAVNAPPCTLTLDSAPLR